MKIAFLFPGQGTQYVGMGKELYEKFPLVKDFYDSLEPLDNGDRISDISFMGPEEKLKLTSYTQPCIVALEIAIYKLLDQHGIQAEAVAGLSLGEYAALAYAGVIHEKEAVSLVYKRGKIMESSIQPGVGTMAAVMGIEDSILQTICEQISEEPNQLVEIANYNCPGQRIISGHTSAVKKAAELAKEQGARRIIPLNVAGPFHSSLYREAGLKLRAELSNANLHDIKRSKIFFNLYGDTSAEPIIDIMEKQMSYPIRFEKSIEKMIDQGIDTFIEVGPGKTLGAFAKKINRASNIYNIEDVSGLESILKAKEV